MEKILPIGEYIEKGINSLEQNLSFLWGGIDDGISWIVENMNDLLLAIPIVVLLALVAFIAYYVKAGNKMFTKTGLKKAYGLTIFVILGLLLIFAMGYWEEAIQTTTLVIVSTIIALILGIPFGIWSAKSNTADTIIRPILDFMQTMPAFVYLIPAVMFFGLGLVPGVVATFVFALPPLIRLTNLGIRQVPVELVEAADAFGATEMQKLLRVQIPVARPTILAGVNQSIMLGLSMVVIAAMIGAGGLGEDVLRGIQRLQVGQGFEAGLVVVILAIILDRITAGLGVKKNATK